MIRHAETKDIEGTLSLQSEHLLSNKKGSTEGGFLFYPLDLEELKKIIDEKDSHILFVSQDEEKINGYILGYDLLEWKKSKPKWDEGLDVSEKVKKILRDEIIIYLRHIVRAREAKGVGKQLLGAILGEAVERGYTFAIAEILSEPQENTVSRSFAQKNGFSEVGEIQYKDNTVWGLFIKKLSSQKGSNFVPDG